ncbi:MAG: diguanylate cyclase [Nitrospirota bacterium]|nr:diguanylate cyclase [Nitrospirota bacterium]
MAKAKILLVEDDKLQAEVAKDYLEANGYEIIWVENGKSAIKMAKTQPVELILLDLVLPDLDGNEVCRWLKLNEDTKGIPIIILTVKSSTMEKVTGLEAGADDYLPKPYNEIELNARIYACLRTKALQDELRRKNRQLEEVLLKVETLAITDPLTELFNRRHFSAAIEKEFNRTVRFQSPTSCLMIDIDYFKKVNDEYGHHAGDLVLKEIARIIKDHIRKIDTAARWGGEEFIVLLPETKKEDALQAAKRILEGISGHQFSGVPGKITVSIGAVSVPEASVDTAEKMIHASDLALYDAKAKRRNRIEAA